MRVKYFFRLTNVALCMFACAQLLSDISAGALPKADTKQRSADNIKLADHHAHIFSPAVRQWLEKELKLPPLPSLGVEELVAVLQKDDVDKAGVFSNAYFFGRGMGASKPDDPRAVMAENDRVADAVAKYPDRLFGFFSVNPLSEAALAEISRCAQQKKFVGLKLHLANSEIDLRNPAHVKRLAEVFELANSFHLVIAIHLRTQRVDYGREDAQIFVDQVLPKAPDIPVQIAHLAGWGGYDEATDGALSAFVDWLAEKKRRHNNLYFDVSAVIRQVRGASPPGASSDIKLVGQAWWPEKRYQRLVERLRKLGLSRILFGTDWPEWTPRSYAADIEKNLLLEKHELRALLTNRAPWLR